jgi:hypothetical protein
MDKPRELEPENLGNISEVKTVSGNVVLAQFAIMELSQIVISNRINGDVNELYPQELQPRDRTDPEKLKRLWHTPQLSRMGNSSSSTDGAPFINDDFVVESGNGRLMNLTRAYALNTASDYRERLEQAAMQFGIDSSVPKVMRQPVLVRIRITAMDSVTFAIDSNHDNDAVSQGDKSIVRNMFESTSFDVILSDIENAGSIQQIKDALIYRANTATVGAGDEIENLVNMFVDILGAAIKSGNSKAYLENYSSLHSAATRYAGFDYPLRSEVLRLAAVKLFGIPDASGEMVLQPTYVDVFSFNEMYKKASSTNYQERLEAFNYRQLINRNITNKRIDRRLLLAFASPKITIQELDAYLSGQDSFVGVDGSPIDDLKAEGQFVIDFITQDLDGEGVEVSKESRMKLMIDSLRAINLISLNDDDVSTPEALAKDVTQGVRTMRDRYLRNHLSGLRATQYKAKNDAVDRVTQMFERHIFEDGYDEALTAINEYLEFNKMPDPKKIGHGLMSAINTAETERLYGPTIEKLSNYVADMVTDFEKTGSQIGVVSKNAVKQLKKERIDVNSVSKWVDDFAAVTSNTVGPITLEHGESSGSGLVRAYSVPNSNIIGVGRKITKGVMWHELGHKIEDKNPKIAAATAALLRKRHDDASAPKVVPLSKYHSWASSKEYMVDKFIHEPYESVFYAYDSFGNRKPDIQGVKSSELVSKGFEWLSDKKTMKILMLNRELLEIIIAAIEYLKNK